MNKYVREFIKRGLMCCWGGPIVLAIVWVCIDNGSTIKDISLFDASISIISITILAFIVAGISMVYQIEKLPIAMAGLIQFFVIYIVYLVVYLLNGWFDTSVIFPYTIIFIFTFIVIWLIIYLTVRNNVNRLNKHIEKD